MELFNYYNLDECVNKKLVISELKSLRADGKIEYHIDGDILKIEDIDLDEDDIDELTELLDSNDVFPHLDYEEDSDDNYDSDDEQNDDY